MLEMIIISQFESSWTSPIVLATKKDGIPRLCINFRNLNAVMNSNKRIVRIVDEIFGGLKGDAIFTTPDLFQVYWRIKMDATCKEKTNLIRNFGTYKFEVMPFGLKNSDATHRRMMNIILLEINSIKCYNDYVTIHSETEESHIN